MKECAQCPQSFDSLDRISCLCGIGIQLTLPSQSFKLCVVSGFFAVPNGCHQCPRGAKCEIPGLKESQLGPAEGTAFHVYTGMILCVVQAIGGQATLLWISTLV